MPASVSGSPASAGGFLSCAAPSASWGCGDVFSARVVEFYVLGRILSVAYAVMTPAVVDLLGRGRTSFPPLRPGS
jgi:hypothetical protein